MSQNKNTGEKAVKEAQKAYGQFEELVAFKEDDSTLMLIGKVLLRLLGILVLIILSPFLLVGLLLAFMAAA